MIPNDRTPLRELSAPGFPPEHLPTRILEPIRLRSSRRSTRRRTWKRALPLVLAFSSAALLVGVLAIR